MVSALKTLLKDGLLQRLKHLQLSDCSDTFLVFCPSKALLLFYQILLGKDGIQCAVSH
jgi:hypothetical protein